MADLGRGARGARYPLKKKKKEREKKKHVDLVHDELKSDSYEDTGVDVDGRFQESQLKTKKRAN